MTKVSLNSHLNCVSQALEAGHEVSVLARTPSKQALENSKLTVIQGDITDAEKVEQVVADSEAVKSVLGPTQNKPEYMVSQGIDHIIAAMDKNGIRRLVVSAGAGVADPDDDPKFINKVFGFLIRTLTRYVYEDMTRTIDAVRATDLDWIIVRTPKLTDDLVKVM
jgi:nucleoside-diphosphate-sugar epimerase